MEPHQYHGTESYNGQFDGMDLGEELVVPINEMKKRQWVGLSLEDTEASAPSVSIPINTFLYAHY